jgi:hypothetical protein
MDEKKLNGDWLFDESEISSETYEQLARERELKKLRDCFFNDGYREGLSDGKDSALQLRFLSGLEIGGECGFALGQLTGILSSLCLYYSHCEGVDTEVKREIDELCTLLTTTSRHYRQQQTLPTFVLTETNTKLLVDNTTNRAKWTADYHQLYERLTTLCLKLGLSIPPKVHTVTNTQSAHQSNANFRRDTDE